MKITDYTNYTKNLSNVALNASSLQQLSQASDVLNGNLSAEEKAKASAKNFESLVISQLLGFMFDTVKVDKLMGGGFGEEAFRQNLIDEYSNIISKSGGIGIADAIQKKLISLQQNQT